jgi:predicted  nucleic acid-binding Zn-ribbon protein
MHGELDALLSLQVTDLRIADLERQLEALSPRIRDIERRKREQMEAVERAQAAVQVEERRQHDLQRRIAEHTSLHERNTAQLDSVKTAREAGAATAQLDVTKRIIAEDEAESKATNERIRELRGEVEKAQERLLELEVELEGADAEVAERRTELEGELKSARSERDVKATAVSRPMLGKYDRIRGRRANALYPIRGQSCGHCDTAIPLHRRSQMQARGGIEVCEACGVLLYLGTGA